MNSRLVLAALSTTLLLTTQAYAQSDDDAAREMARKAQDPLGDIRAIMNDNTIGFGAAEDDDIIFNLQLQPVYAIKNNTKYNMIARAVIPILGLEEGTYWPPLGQPPQAGGSHWGLSDIMLQYFFSPKSEGNWKYGFGPQVSLDTSSSDRQKCPGYGAGIAAVVFGGVGNWALGSILMQHWGEDDFNAATVQLIAMYNFDSIPGAYMGYNNAININWEANSSNKYTVPLGVTAGRTILLKSGNGLDFSGGIYGMLAQPEDSPDWQLKLGVSYFFN